MAGFSATVRDKAFWRRNGVFIGVIAVMVVVIAVVLCLLNAPSGGNDTPPPVKTSVRVAHKVQTALEGMSVRMLGQLGRFGIDYAHVDPSTLKDTLYQVSQGTTSDMDPQMYRSRSSAYLSVLPDIASGSPIDYDTRGVAQWYNPWESDNGVSYAIKDISVHASHTGTLVDGTMNRPKVVVTASFTSTLSYAARLSDDATSSNVYHLYTHDVHEDHVKLAFVKQKGVWKLYSTDLPDHFVLATWRDPSSDAYHLEQLRFTDRGSSFAVPSATPSTKAS